MRQPRYLEDRAPGVTVGLFRSTPSYRLPVHGHDRAHACIVLDGTMEERHDGRDRRMEPGSIRLSPAGDAHRIRFGPAGGLCLLVLVDSGAGSDLETASVRERVFGRAGHLQADAVALGRAMEGGDSMGPLVAESFAIEILARAAPTRVPGSPPPWLLRIRERLRDAPQDVASLARLAREAGVHPGHLVRSFRAHFGCTPGAFLRLWRVERARREVTGTGRALAGIAFSAGFADQAHMTREFRQRLGTTPGALRKAAGM